MHPSSGLVSESPPSTGPILYAVGTSGELRELSLALTGRGHDIEDVSFDQADERLLMRRAHAIVMDAEGSEALAFIQRLVQIPEIRPHYLALIGHFSEPIPSVFSLLHHFERPVDLSLVINTVDSALRERHDSFSPHSSAAPSSHPDLLTSGPSLFPPMPGGYASESGRAGALLSFPAGWLPSSDVPSSPPSPGGAASPSSGPLRATRNLAGPTSVSPDLERRLLAAEERLSAESLVCNEMPEDAEINALLSDEVLAALQEPLEFEENANRQGSYARTPAATTGTSASLGTSIGQSDDHPALTRAFAPATQAAVAADSLGQTAAPPALLAQPEQQAEPTGLHRTRESHASAPPPADSDRVFDPEPSTSYSRPALAPRSQSSTRPPAHKNPNPFQWIDPQSKQADRAFPPSEPPTSRGSLTKGADPAKPVAVFPISDYSPGNSSYSIDNKPNNVENVELILPEVLNPDFDGLYALATCIASRATVTVCFEAASVLRRAVLRDGDFVACSSSENTESLLSFLIARGDLPKELAAKLNNKFPAFGRHAAAALIANGHLGQDQLWTVLRSHAEWLLGKMLLVSSGICAVENEPPGRLKAEPAVFGGATGAEVLVEVTRRVVPEQEAVRRLLGLHTRISEGPRSNLLSECALSDFEASILRTSFGRSIGELLDETGHPDFAALVLALTALGVLEIVRSIGASLRPLSGPAFDEIDAEAVRRRVLARLAIVQEGDYFEVLGVPRSATAYEIKRAFLEARRNFDPSHLLTAATADLLDDLRTVVACIEEAYEVLRDPSRCERYRRAIQATPPQL